MPARTVAIRLLSVNDRRRFCQASPWARAPTVRAGTESWRALHPLGKAFGPLLQAIAATTVGA